MMPGTRELNELHLTVVRFCIILIAVVAVAVVLVSTARFGIGLTPDSAAYLSATQGLVQGNGFTQYDGSVYASWPPLYPVALASLSALGLVPSEAARYLNAVLFGGDCSADWVLALPSVSATSAGAWRCGVCRRFPTSSPQCTLCLVRDTFCFFHDLFFARPA